MSSVQMREDSRPQTTRTKTTKVAATSLVGRGVRRLARTAVLAGGVALAWGSVERRFPTVRHYEVPVAARPGFTGIRLLHFSDLHLYEGQEFLIDFLRNVERREHVDAVISTGDNFGSPTALPLTLRAHEIFADYPGAFVFGSNDYFSPRPKSWTRYLFSHTSTGSRLAVDGVGSGSAEHGVGGSVEPECVPGVGRRDGSSRRRRRSAYFCGLYAPCFCRVGSSGCSALGCDARAVHAGVG